MEFDVSKFYLSRMIRKEKYKTCKQLFKKLNKDDLYLKGLSLTKVDGESKSRKIYFFFLKHHMFCTAPLSLDQGAIAMMDGFHGIHPSALLQSHRRGFLDEIHV